MDEKTCWNAIVNKDSGPLDIYFQQEIGFLGDNSKDFSELMAQNKNKDVRVFINSIGGSVHDGISIHNILLSHEKDVDVIITGTASSIAGVLAMSGKRPPKMYSNTTMMLHPPLITIGGNAKFLREKADILDMLEENILHSLMRFFNGTRDELSAIIKKTTYMNAKTAQSYGLATIINESYKIKNFYNFEDYGYPPPPSEILDCYKNEDKTIVDKIKDLLNPKNQEPDGMKQEEFENKIAESSAIVAALEVSNKTLAAENEELKNKFAALDAETAKNQADKVTAELNGFVNTLVEAGKLKPVDAAKQVAKLEALNKAGADFLNAEKDFLNAIEPIVDLSGAHFADKKDSAPTDSEKALDSAIKAHTDKGMSYRDAAVAVALSNPELIQEV